jgi:CBS domain-containing protein
MNTVADIIHTKKRAVWCISPNSSVMDALQLMNENKVGALLVVDDNDVLGVLCEKDFARKLVLKGKPSSDTTAHEIMTGRVTMIKSDKSVADCVKLMKEKRLRYLAVYDEDRPIGLITVMDMFQAIIADQRKEIRKLEEQISEIFDDLATMTY